jgi:hypothetical protein
VDLGLGQLFRFGVYQLYNKAGCFGLDKLCLLLCEFVLFAFVFFCCSCREGNIKLLF